MQTDKIKKRTDRTDKAAHDNHAKHGIINILQRMCITPTEVIVSQVLFFVIEIEIYALCKYE